MFYSPARNTNTFEILDNMIVLRPVIQQHLYLKHSLFFIRYSERSRIWSEIRKHGRDGAKSQGERTKRMKLKGRKKEEQKM
jgi:hypothetical protein